MLLNHECLSNRAESPKQQRLRLFTRIDPHLGSFYLGWYLVVILFLTLVTFIDSVVRDCLSLNCSTVMQGFRRGQAPKSPRDESVRLGPPRNRASLFLRRLS